jgi:hypothetical protein
MFEVFDFLEAIQKRSLDEVIHLEPLRTTELLHRLFDPRINTRPQLDLIGHAIIL